MSKSKCPFKVGDILIGNKSNHYSLTSCGVKVKVTYDHSYWDDSGDDMTVAILHDDGALEGKFSVNSKHFDLVKAKTVVPTGEFTVNVSNNTITVRLNSGAIGTAKCNTDEDDFSYDTGIKLAYERAKKAEKKAEEEKSFVMPHFYFRVGDRVRLKTEWELEHTQGVIKRGRHDYQKPGNNTLPDSMFEELEGLYGTIDRFKDDERYESDKGVALTKTTRGIHCWSVVTWMLAPANYPIKH